MQGVIFEFTHERNELIKTLSNYGVRIPIIAQAIGCCERTIRGNDEAIKIFREGKAMMVGKVAKSAFDRAIEGDPVMISLIMRTVGLWKKETYVDELLKDGETFNGNFEENIAKATELLTAGLISVEVYDTLCGTFLKTYQAVEHESRITNLEQMAANAQT